MFRNKEIRKFSFWLIGGRKLDHKLCFCEFVFVWHDLDQPYYAFSLFLYHKRALKGYDRHKTAIKKLWQDRFGIFSFVIINFFVTNRRFMFVVVYFKLFRISGTISFPIGRLIVPNRFNQIDHSHWYDVICIFSVSIGYLNKILREVSPFQIIIKFMNHDDKKMGPVTMHSQVNAANTV